MQNISTERAALALAIIIIAFVVYGLATDCPGTAGFMWSVENE